MKRILAMLLAMIMVLSMFAGCRPNTPIATTEPTTVESTQDAQPDLQLEKAIEYLRAFYKNAAEKTAMDYTRLATVRIGITSYDVVWSVDVPEEVLKIVKNEDNTYTIDINEEAFKESTEAVPYVLTATITGKDGRTLTISWEHIIPAAIDQDVIDAIKQAYALQSGQSLEGTYTLTGVITSINTPYDPSYKNVTVTIEVPGAEDMPIKCYRLKGDGADKLAVGDTITVTGSFTNYNGSIQLAQGCVLEAVESGGGAAPVAPENPVDILKQAYALAPGNSLPYTCSLTGTITSVDYAYDPNYGNITVTMKTNGYSIKCYRLKGAGIEDLNVNDVITVSGVITNYNGTIEFASGCQLIDLINKEPPAKIPDPTPGTQVSIANAITIGQQKDHNTYTEGKYYVTGKIVSIDNTTYGNMYISDGSNKLLIYGTWSEDGNTRFDKLNPQPSVGDTITLYGVIGRYGTNPQMKNAWIIGAKGDTPVIPDAPSVDVATELVAGTPYRFGMAQGNLEDAVYYLAGGMNGYYMATTADPAAAINVYVEETAGGYYFYTLQDDAKVYINMVVSGEHVNGAYESTASTVYTYNSASNTLIATIDGAEYWFGTRNDKTYTTMGPCKVEYAGFFGKFYVGSAEAPVPPTPEDPDVPQVGELVADKTYKFGMAQGKLDNKVYYLAGGMNGYYMATTDDMTAAIDVYVEVTEGGYYFYTLEGETKLYINMVVSGTHVNGAYEATASTVYTYNAEKNTLIAIVNDAEYWFGTRNDATYTTMGPCKVEYAGFFGQFYDPNATEPDEPEEPDVPVVPEEPEEPTAGLKEGVAYTISADNKNGTLWFNGTITGGRFNGSYEKADAVSVYAENVTDGFLLYFMDGETKQYICIEDKSAGGSFSTDAATATVFEWNADKATAAVAEDSNNRGFGCGATSTYTNFSAYDLSGDYNWGQFIAVDGGNTEPEQPTCEHTETKVEGAVEATCTTEGHTGKTVCAACGEVISEGEVIPATGHSYENGTCTGCGEADPNAPVIPDEPETGLVAGKAYKFGMTQGNLDNKVYYLAGGMSGYYMATTTDIAAAIDVYVEETEGGYYFYTLDGETKLYINMVVSGTHVNGKYDATASTVYTYNAEKDSLIAIVNNTEYWFGTRDDKTYTTMGPIKVYYNGQYDGFYGEFYEVATEEPECQHTETKVEGAVEATCTTDGHTGKTVCAACGEVISEGEVIPATGHSFANGTCGTCGAEDPNYTPDEPGETSNATYTMSEYKVTGELGGGEAVRNLDENVKFTISSGWFSTEARIYKTAYGVIESKKPIASLVLNAGYKDSTFDVYTSEDGVTWTKHSNQAYTSSYSDVTITFETPVQYIKLDAPNAQLRIKTITVNFAGAAPETNVALTEGTWKQFSVVSEGELLSLNFYEDGAAGVSAMVYMTVEAALQGEGPATEFSDEEIAAAIADFRDMGRTILEYNGKYYVDAGFGYGRDATFVEDGNTVVITAMDYEGAPTGVLTLERVNGNQLKVVAVEGIIIDEIVTEHILVGSIFGEL